MWYKNAPCTKDQRAQILDEVFGKGWMDKDDMDTAEWFCYCRIRGVSRELTFLRIARLFKEWNVWEEEHDLALVWVRLFDRSWVDTALVLESEQKSHNKSVHALNGNTSLAQVMADVDQAPSMYALYAPGGFDSLKKTLRGSETQLMLTTMPSDVNPVSVDIRSQAALNSKVISNTDVISANAHSLPLPLTTLIPREVRNAGGVLINSTQRLFIIAVAPLEFRAVDVTDTDLATILIEAAIKANMNLGRRDNTVLNGFLALDMAAIARLKAYYGLCMDQCFAKIALLNSIVAWLATSNMCPASELSVIDQNTLPGVGGTFAVGYNDSPVFGELCGGATALFPVSGVAGTVEFHLCTESMLPEDRADMIVMPPGLISLDDAGEPGVMMILFLMMWAEWPTSLWTVAADTTDTAGLNPAQQTYVPVESLIHIPGRTRLIILMPRATTAFNPTSLQDANARVLRRAASGPTPATSIPASTDLDMCFVGVGGRTTYNLAELFYTWGAALDTATISNYMSRMQAIVGVKRSMERVLDLLDNMRAVIPAMVLTDGTAPVVFTANSAAQAALVSPCGVRTVQTTVNWPQPNGPRPDWIMNKTDNRGWNKVATGVSSCNEGIEVSELLDESFSSPLEVYWKSLRSMVSLPSGVHTTPILDGVLRHGQVLTPNLKCLSFVDKSESSMLHLRVLASCKTGLVTVL
jgi:hypothetical protein